MKNLKISLIVLFVLTVYSQAYAAVIDVTHNDSQKTIILPNKNAPKKPNHAQKSKNTERQKTNTPKDTTNTQANNTNHATAVAPSTPAVSNTPSVNRTKQTTLDQVVPNKAAKETTNKAVSNHTKPASLATDSTKTTNTQIDNPPSTAPNTPEKPTPAITASQATSTAPTDGTTTPKKISATKDITECNQIHLPDYLSFSNLELCQYHTGVPLVVVSGEGKYGFVDHTGKVIIEPIFDEAWSFKENIALIKKDNQWGYIRSDSSYLAKPQFEDAWGFYEQFAKVKKDGKYGFINHRGDTVIPIKYDETGNWFENGVVAVFNNNKWGLIDKTGRLLTPMIYDYIGQTNGERITVAGKVNDDTLYGFINPKGELVIALQYTYATDFSEGSAYVARKDGSYQYIDTAGNLVENNTTP